MHCSWWSSQYFVVERTSNTYTSDSCFLFVGSKVALLTTFQSQLCGTKIDGKSETTAHEKLLWSPWNFTHCYSGRNKSAYRIKLLECHPDRNPGDLNAGDKTIAITNAYKILGNTESRAQYDRTGLRKSLLQQMLDLGIIKPHLTKYGLTVYGLTVPYKVRLPHHQINEMKRNISVAKYSNRQKIIFWTL